MIASFAKAVKPGGWIVISTPNMRNVQVLWQFFIGGDWPEQVQAAGVDAWVDEEAAEDDASDAGRDRRSDVGDDDEPV